MRIKDYIINNFKDDDINTIRNAISECVMEDDEETLPGMGVFLMLIWKGADEDIIYYLNLNYLLFLTILHT